MHRTIGACSRVPGAPVGRRDCHEGRRRRAAAAVAAWVSADARDVAWCRAASRTRVHGRGRRSAGLRRLRTAAARDARCAAFQASVGRSNGHRDGRTRIRNLRSLWARPRWRAAYRMASSTTRHEWYVSQLYIVPTAEMYDRADRAFGFGYWHWFFLILAGAVS